MSTAREEADRRWPHDGSGGDTRYARNLARYRIGFRHGAKWQASRPHEITDAMVDACARSNYEFQNRACIHYVPAWDSIPDDDPWKLAYREEARAALEAAEAARDTPEDHV